LRFFAISRSTTNCAGGQPPWASTQEESCTPGAIRLRYCASPGWVCWTNSVTACSHSSRSTEIHGLHSSTAPPGSGLPPGAEIRSTRCIGNRSSVISFMSMRATFPLRGYGRESGGLDAPGEM
jgi:hypothetical protein